MQQELLLQEEQRFTLFPIKYPQLWQQYKKQLASFWIVEEIDFSKDYQDWTNKLNDDERYFIKMILAFFAGADGIVNLNIMENFSKEVKILEAQYAYIAQSQMEQIHSETYSLMIETLIKDQQEKNKLFNAIEHIPCIQKKAQWALKWINNSQTELLQKRLIAFTIVEGIFFSGAFCAIYWLKQRSLMPGLTKSNEFIARDEGMHTEFGIMLYLMFINKLKQQTVYNMVQEAVDIEKQFITESINCNMIGMNQELMKQYIEYVADRLLVQLGYQKIYNVQNPFLFMTFIGLESRSNFFDEKTSTYQKPQSFSQDDYNKQKLQFDDDF